MEMNRLDGKIAIITGAAQGIGAGFAKCFTAEGATVIAVDRQESVAEVAAAAGGTAHCGNVADATFVRAVVDATVAEHGRVDILVNNAGEVWKTGATDDWETGLADYDQLMGSNFRGAFLFGRAVAPLMVDAGGGNIINASTDHVNAAPETLRHHGHGAMDLYNAAKWALNGLTFDWAKALAPHSVRVNNLCMGATDTEMIRGWVGGDPDPEYVATWMTPEGIAEVAIQLVLEGPTGRTGDNIGLWAGHETVLPPPEVG